MRDPLSVAGRPLTRGAWEFTRDCREVLRCVAEAAGSDDAAAEPSVREAARRLLAVEPSDPDLAEIDILATEVMRRFGPRASRPLARSDKGGSRDPDATGP